jgi:hypothetical protein
MHYDEGEHRPDFSLAISHHEADSEIDMATVVQAAMSFTFQVDGVRCDGELLLRLSIDD